MKAIERCSACPAEIVWLSHERTGKAAPIDAAPADGGNIIPDFDGGTYRVQKIGHGLEVARHFNHFATCPEAKRFRA